MENAREETAEKRAQDPYDDVAEQSEPMTQRYAAGQEPGHQADQAPDQDRVQVKVDRGPVDAYGHASSPPLQRRTRRWQGFPSALPCGRTRASSERTAGSPRPRRRSPSR